MAESVSVVLVHGTFARDAAWTAPETSGLCQRIRDALSGRSVTFHRFTWSGANSHADRDAGGRALGLLLRELAATGEAPLFVIGHSHGGTVITRALKHHPELVHILSGVVFLSTPFIQVQRRPFAQSFLKTTGVVLALLLSVVAGLSFQEGLSAIAGALKSFAFPAWLKLSVLLTLAFPVANWIVRRYWHQRTAQIQPFAQRESVAALVLGAALSFGGFGGYALLVHLGVAGWLAFPAAFFIASASAVFAALILSVLRTQAQREGAPMYRQAIETRRSRVDIRLSALISDFSLPPLDPDRTLFVRTNADEASLGLTFVHAISRGISEVFTGLFKVTLALGRVRGVLPGSTSGASSTAGRVAVRCMQIAAAIAAVAMAPIMWDDFQRWLSLTGWHLPGTSGAAAASPTDWEAVGATSAAVRQILLACVPVAGTLASVGLGLSALVLVLFSRAFGQWFLLSALLLEVSVEPVPPGQWTLLQYDAMDQSPDWGPDHATVLSHSMSYEDPRARDAVGRWMAHRIGSAKQA